MEAVRVLRPPMPRSSRSGTLSIIQAAAIDDRRVGAAELRVLVALGTYADHDGWCWPKQKQLADRIGVSRQAVSKSLRDLQEHGYIEIHEQHDSATGSQIASRYRVLMDFVLRPEHRRTPQPDIAGGQRQIAPPRNVGFTPPATSEVAPIERPNRTTQKERPKKKRSDERLPKAPTPGSRVIDLIVAGGAESPTFSGRDGKAIKETGAAPELVAAAYLAVWRGEWGDEWLRDNLSIHAIVDRLDGFRVWQREQAPPPEHVNGTASKLTPATDGDREVWERARTQLAATMNAANFEGSIAPLTVAGRGVDGGLRLLVNPLVVPHLAGFRHHISRALEDAGDEKPLAVAFVTRRTSQESSRAE